MLKKELMNELNNENHYTVPRYVLSYAKELGLDMDSLILLIYFLNKPNKSIFDYKKIIEDINFTEKELLNALSTLKDKNILLILMEKNDSGVLEEKVDISLFYEIIFSKILNKETKENNEKDLYDNFEKEFGRTLSPMEYEIINSWKEQKISNELILSALKEAVFNGVNNLRYIDKILYEYEWDGVNAKYLDTEYQFHLEYFKETIKKMTNHIDGFFKSTKDELLEIFERLCQMPRFTLSIIKEFGNLILLNKEVAERLFNHFERLNPDQLENNIVISYLKSLYKNNHEQYIDACEDILRFVMNDVLTFANHDLQKEIGNRILEIEGYDLLIDLFSKDYNTFLFVCFPISTFPPEYKEIMRLELEKAIRFYAARMNHDEYRLTSFEQVANINRLLMEEYKEEYSNGKE